MSGAAFVDVAIVGGGCAGLSLATRLTAHESVTAVVIERRPHYQDDRTWCGWPVVSHRFDRCVRREWPAWRLSAAAGDVTVNAGRFHYESIPSREFYREARHAIEGSANVSLLLGEGVSSIAEDDAGAEITLNGGRHIRARWAIDTRPCIREIAYPWMWQSFVGVEVEAAGAIGDDVPDIMDFRVPQLGGPTFLYRIPFTRDRALFELTCFAPEPTPQATLLRGLRELLSDRLPGGYRSVRIEHADLPMAPAEPQAKGRIVAAGIAGGAMRPSTGFAFHTIQRWASECEHELLAGRRPSKSFVHPAVAWMDRVFMSVIRDEPKNAPSLYLRLFAQAKPDSLIRFLAGVPRANDIADVVAALPLMKFSRAAAHSFVA